MGSGFGEGEDRAVEAAQEAVSSPLLDNVSIRGAQGVLINITGGMDLAIDEVTQISSIIQEEAGDEAEIIFGAVHDESLEGKVRVTVIATGFDATIEADEPKVIRPDFRRSSVSRMASWSEGQQSPEAERRPVLVGAAVADAADTMRDVVPLQRPPERTVDQGQIGELDIPTFIRRQMD